MTDDPLLEDKHRGNAVDERIAAGSGDVAPGDESAEHDLASGIRGYVIGLVLATALTVVSFFVARTTLVWQPSIPMALTVLAIAQMGVHLVFFLHITSGPDNLNNVLALAFGLLIVMLVVFGSLWIMGHLDHHAMPLEEMQKMQR
jgi:cytochrome o ubiquinol oxidase operon protein cyoD